MSLKVNGQCPITNGMTNGGTSNPCLPETSPKSEKKPVRKKSVSFLENVTDIDTGIDYGTSNIQEGDPSIDEEEDLGDIFNISEKINFFKNAFNDQPETKESRSLGHQTSIPQARLAFVTGMVQSPLAGNHSRADGQGRDDTATVAEKDEGGDTDVKKCFVVSVEVPSEEKGVQLQNGEEMATTLTFSKIFAHQKTMVVEKGIVGDAVVDTSSILEHREELRELWEKRMMSDDNQSSSSSSVPETNAKPLKEEDTEEKVVKSESESSNHSHKMTNGFVKHDEPDSNANHIHESAEKVKSEVRSAEADNDNNNSADSLEEDNVEDCEGQKTYTSSLEQALVMTQVEEVSSETQITTTTTVVEKVHETEETVHKAETKEITSAITVEEYRTEKIEAGDVKKIEESSAAAEVEVSSAETTVVEKEIIKEAVQEVAEANEESLVPTPAEESIIQDHQNKQESLSDKLIIPDAEGDGDGFVRVEECLPKDDNPDEPLDIPGEHDEHCVEDTPSSNGFEEQSLPVSPISSTSSEKAGHPEIAEIEQFVKAGGVKRIIPGVQKTEQPYNTCTTETKIAMEIREMREREEELRLMREQSLSSPVASPVPPKTPTSIRSPSPSPKDSLSPSPQGPGYRVSSVFGHRGISPSPSVEEDKKSYKTFSKESAVEKEIRLAKDREEELRKQKGLPPREDDSYVKPSQVKSSQVRVFGKMAGANSNSVKQAATAKIQMEIEEQTQREMALRETGNIQTISQERTDSRVAKLKSAENVPQTNGNSPSPVNGNHTNGRSSPDVPYKRSSPSPTNARPASIFAQSNGKGNISMHKFIASKGKETAFTTPRNGPFQPKEENNISRSAVPPPMVKLKRNVSVESKIQQEILEMKQREEELRKMHMNATNGNSVSDENSIEHEMNQKNNLEYENGNGHGISDEEISPRHNKLIAQWEQRIQRAES